MQNPKLGYLLPGADQLLTSPWGNPHIRSRYRKVLVRRDNIAYYVRIELESNVGGLFNFEYKLTVMNEPHIPTAKESTIITG
jgi:hypothetical protein